LPGFGEADPRTDHISQRAITMNYASSWTKRLASLAHLSTEDESILSGLTFGARVCKVDDGYVESKDVADHVLVVVEGIACRFRMLPDGRRQILAYLFAGDMTSPERLLVRQPGQSISLLVPSQIAVLNRSDMDGLQSRPNICTALGRASLVRQATTSEWQVNVGVRTAAERLSHLLCEIYTRLESVGLTNNLQFMLPLTQLQLAESLALSAVHVNRTLMELRRQKLVDFRDRVVTILDYERLCEVAGFDPSYLQLVDIEWMPEVAGAKVAHATAN
jgi:CRP-like cAMP-binding protein